MNCQIVNKRSITKLSYVEATGLHNEDEVMIIETGEIVTVLQAYPDESGKFIIVECDDGNTYCHDEIA